MTAIKGRSLVPESTTRNPLIARLLRQAGLAEQAGSGLPLIRRTWDETGRPTPELRNEGGRKRFEMAFPWGEEPVSRPAEPVNEPLNEPVNPANETLSARLLRLLIDEPGLRVPALEARLGASKSSIKRALKALKADGRVTFRGASKTGGYYLTSSDAGESD